MIVINNIQNWIESKLEKDKLEHFFIASILILPISVIWHNWIYTLICAVLMAGLKEGIDKWIRRSEWNWIDIIWTVAGGVVQGIILVTK